MKILIAGGGIGGMSLALSLWDAGLRDVHIFESAVTIKEIGAGINVLPHAARELAELGLLDALDDVAMRTGELAYYSKNGQLIWAEPRGLAAGYGWPQLSIHRGELLSVLHRAVLERFGPERVHAGHHLLRFDGAHASSVTAAFGTPGGDPRVIVDGDVLVACDGVHSVVRSTLFPAEGPPKWNGITMYRGITAGRPFLTGRTMIMAGHFHQRVVVYPISQPRAADGRVLLNWVAEIKTAQGQPMPRQDWEYRASADEAIRPFASFRFDFLDVPAMIGAAEAIYRYPMVDRDPLPTWDFGRITLLGDAAHPMYPIGSNGASQAIIDGRVLARELALQPSIEAAITAYDSNRRPATAAVVLANREVGPEKCMEIVEQRAPDGFERLDDIISQDELNAISVAYKQKAGFDPATLNSRPSFSVR